MFYRPRILTLLALFLLAACALNPATGKRQLSLIGESQEVEMGRETDPTIRRTFGSYDDDELQAYVEQVGRRLAAVSERPGLDWHFQVLDDTTVNAFAVPGGYIYVTRGILAQLDSEAELAGVLGHEIGHVTARHSVNQLSKAQIWTASLGVGMILSPELAQFGQLAQQALGIMFMKFSRDDEKQSDDLGLRYMERAGYDPHVMPEVFEMLRRVSESGEAGRVPAWASTHPDPERRFERTQAQLAGIEKAGTVGIEDYLERIDGMTFGPDPREGVFTDNRFDHAELGFRFEFPPGWKTVNAREVVFAGSGDQRALIQISLARETNPEAAARQYFAAQDVSAGAEWVREIRGLPTESRGFRRNTEGGIVRGMVAFVRLSGRIYQIEGMAAQESWEGYEGIVLDSMASFRQLTDARALAAQPDRVEIVRLTENLTIAEVAQRYPVTVSIKTLALVNNVAPDDRLEAGRQVKLIVGG
jgi:predicted Zn-dependent protease